MGREIKEQGDDGLACGAEERDSQELTDQVVADESTRRNVTERKRANQELQTHLVYLESMERMDRAIRQHTDLDDMLSAALDAALDIFGADRAWLLFPCDPNASSWRVPMERTRVSYPGAMATGEDIAMDDEARAAFEAALGVDEPVVFDPASGLAPPQATASRFGIKSQIMVALHPKIGRAWLFGLHQCSHARVWNVPDARLFKAIARRLTDGLSSLLALRNVRSSEERYRELVEGTDDLVVVVDPEGCFTFVNDAARNTLGFQGADWMGASLLESLVPDDRERAQHAFAGWLKALDRAASLECRHVSRSTGQVHTVQWRLAIHMEPGERHEVRGIGRDVTERVKAERDLRELEAQLVQSQKMEALGTLASGVAHDFNNLLQAIGGYTQLMMAHDGLEEMMRSHLKQVELATGRAADLVRRLLTLSRKRAPELRQIDVNAHIGQTVATLERIIPKMVQIQMHLDPELWFIDADGGQLEQVLINLGTNARDAMPRGGTLRIASSNTILDAAFCRMHLGSKPGRHVLISVSDTGHGIDEQVRAHIFEPFFTTKGLHEGTGLGLSTVYSIVKNHGGIIRCSSSLNVGTSFDVYLPAAGGASRCNSVAPEQPAEESAGAETILVVDDEALVLDVVASSLRGNGHRVYEARTGEEALSIFKEHASGIELVILDLGMPGMGGSQCLDQLLELQPSLKVIIASGYSMEAQSRALIERGARAVLDKPYRLADLLRTVRHVLRGGEALMGRTSHTAAR